MERRRLIRGINEPPVVVPVMWFDGLFKAFHHFAISCTTRQRELVDFSVACNLFCGADIARPDARLCTNKLSTTENIVVIQRGTRCFSARVPVIIEDNQNKAPTSCQNGTLFRTFWSGQEVGRLTAKVIKSCELFKLNFN